MLILVASEISRSDISRSSRSRFRVSPKLAIGSAPDRSNLLRRRDFDRWQIIRTGGGFVKQAGRLSLHEFEIDRGG